MPLYDEQKFRIGQRFQTEFQAALGPSPSPRRDSLLGREAIGLPLLNMYKYTAQLVLATQQGDSLDVLQMVLDMQIESLKRGIPPEDFNVIRSVIEPVLWTLSADWEMLLGRSEAPPAPVDKRAIRARVAERFAAALDRAHAKYPAVSMERVKAPLVTTFKEMFGEGLAAPPAARNELVKIHIKTVRVGLKGADRQFFDSVVTELLDQVGDEWKRLPPGEHL